MVQIAPEEDTIATALNDDGLVVGVSAADGPDAERAFAWTLDGGMVDLGTLGGTDELRRTPSTTRGQVVGARSHGRRRRAPRVLVDARRRDGRPRHARRHRQRAPPP